MATVYPTAAGVWSTRTWNNDATGAAYGMAPQAGDIVLANNFSITIDQDITVASLKTIAGTTAAAGGAFSTSGNRTVNADSYAGTSSCLSLAASTSVQNGNSYGSTTTNSVVGTTVGAGCTQNGNSTGGNGSGRNGSLVNSGGTQIGNATGGSGANAVGSTIAAGAKLVGDSFGGSASGCVGASLIAGALQCGNSTGGSNSTAYGSNVTSAVQIGNSTGGSAGTGSVVGNGGIQYGAATGGSASGAHGTAVTSGGMAFITTASGSVANAFGVQSSAVARYVAIIQNESGAYPKSLSAAAETTSTNVPFVSFESGGTSSSRMVNVNGGAEQ